MKILQFCRFFVCKWHVKFSRGKSFVSSWPRVNCLKFIFLEVWELGDVLRWQINVRQALSMEKRFLSPRRGSNPQPSDDRWDALTIELPNLRWWAKVQVQHVWLKRKPLSVNNDIDEVYVFRNVRAWRYLEMIDEQSSSSILTLSLVAQWLERLTGHQVASFIPVWGSEIVFVRIELHDRSSIISSKSFAFRATPRRNRCQKWRTTSGS